MYCMRCCCISMRCWCIWCVWCVSKLCHLSGAWRRRVLFRKKRRSWICWTCPNQEHNETHPPTVPTTTKTPPTRCQRQRQRFRTPVDPWLWQVTWVTRGGGGITGYVLPDIPGWDVFLKMSLMAGKDYTARTTQVSKNGTPSRETTQRDNKLVSKNKFPWK